MKTGFLGGGNMAEALIDALSRDRRFSPQSIHICEINADRRAHLRQRFGVGVHETPDAVLRHCNTIVLAVKPQDLDPLLDQIAPAITSRHLVVSIAAGRTLDGIQHRLGPAARIVRVMPNLAVRVGQGISVYCLGNAARPADRARVERLLSKAGDVLALPEARFNAVTALSGSGPAFLAWLLDAMICAARAHGIDAAAAHRLAVQTMLGTAQVLRDENLPPRALIRAVASRGGTTAAGLAVLEQSDAAAILDATFHAATQRGAELSR